MKIDRPVNNTSAVFCDVLLHSSSVCQKWSVADCYYSVDMVVCFGGKCSQKSK